MRIIFNEIKHIFNWKTILLLVLFTAIFYIMFIKSYTETKSYPEGLYPDNNYSLTVGMLKTYGNSMDAKEFANFKQVYKERVKVADEYLRSHNEFVKAGVKNYKAVQKIDNDPKITEGSKLYELCSTLYDCSNPKVAVFDELRDRESLISYYEKRKNLPYYYSQYSNAAKSIINQVNKGEGKTSVFSWEVLDNYDNFIGYGAALIILCILFTLGPVYLRDRRGNLTYMQYSSKTGRRLFKAKAAASLLSAFIVITLQLLFLFAMYSKTGVGMFLGSKIMAFNNLTYYWYDSTFLQYIALTVVCVYVLGLSAALLTLFASRLMPNYITLIGVFVVVAYVFLNVLPKYMLQRITTLSYPQYFTPLLYAILIAVAVALPVILWRREKKLDIC